MPKAIRNYCSETGQEIPQSVGEVSRCIFESLATKTALILEKLLDIAGQSSQSLHLVGGGARNETICQMIASATEIPVYSGPVESAAVGNILTQNKSYSMIENIQKGRELVKRNIEIQEYWPEEPEEWKRSRQLMSKLADIQDI